MGIEIFFEGCSGITRPVDINATPISEGDYLSWDYGDRDSRVEDWMLKPIFVVTRHKSGGLFGKGIDENLYLHDFRFKHTQKLEN